MARLLSPVCADLIKFQNPLEIFNSRSGFPLSLCKNGTVDWRSHDGMGRRRCRRRVAASAAATQESASFEDIDDDYYAVLGLLPDATPEQIKKAYYNCMKACHPDLSGDDPNATNFSMFVNEVYEVLSDPAQRMVYDEIHGYALTAMNPFLDDSSPKEQVFVDEFRCIGCKNCAIICPSVFSIEEDYGRARACSQSGARESVEQAIESCPVDCIHWTSAAQLSLLEDEMRRVEIVNVALMLRGMGSESVNVFRMASSRWEKRQTKVLRQAKRKMMMMQQNSIQPFWKNVWRKPEEYENSEEEAKERASRAAAAARRWREYSRKGVNIPHTFKLPQATSTKD